MRKLLLIPVLALLLFSCSKNTVKEDTVPQVQTGKHAVSLSIADFIQEHESLGRRSASAKERGPIRLSDIYYAVYDNGGAKMNYIHQDTVNQGVSFGQIIDTLAPGHYTVAIFASESPLTDYMLSNAIHISHSYITPLNNVMQLLPTGEVFYKKFQLEVSATDSSQSLEVSLDRMVGKMQVEIPDALPASYPNGNVSIQYIPVSRVFGIDSSKSLAPIEPFYYNATRVSDTSFEDYLFGSDYGFKLKITYYDKNTGNYTTRTIDNVKCIPNQKTIVKGYLYGNPAAPGFAVKLNESWSSDSTVINL